MNILVSDGSGFIGMRLIGELLNGDDNFKSTHKAI